MSISERLQVTVEGRWMGSDFVVSIGGGTHPHVGAVAVAQPRPSLKGDGSVSATASVIALLGHKEDELARWAALHLAARLNATVVVTAGLHADQATLAEVLHLDAEARRLVEALI
jgi:gallate decarboxylase subunit D